MIGRNVGMVRGMKTIVEAGVAADAANIDEIAIWNVSARVAHSQFPETSRVWYQKFTGKHLENRQDGENVREYLERFIHNGLRYLAKDEGGKDLVHVIWRELGMEFHQNGVRVERETEEKEVHLLGDHAYDKHTEITRRDMRYVRQYGLENMTIPPGGVLLPNPKQIILATRRS